MTAIDSEMITATEGTSAQAAGAGRPEGPGGQETGVLRVLAIEPAVLVELRVRDDAGHPPRLLTDADGGAPLRCCLRRIRPGERVALVSYAPLRRWARATGADPGPYEETGPVFIHPEPCPGPSGRGYPAELVSSPQVFRAYSADGRILGGRLFGAGEPGDADSAEAVLAEILADPAVALVHARAVGYGCFTFEVRRQEAAE